mmetsp:Transcript_26284/g.38966  ORF Transcript_26284/g.38966 Transcript_26284/m.38966 type:complete len:688 (+) Transcript_26284:108-2171(+)|eukprot:CAMPEP_0185035934 /NCGR_PEP_ID=MMETSP1103-20130426/28117_1 /TAXON_ID=36769 /ORGANISM="Paraphysomonas bandaiensis, Strain Caron Lab Isolate" /LENGTH=687 /DNA_ID=CAMNT_0027573247 /DNA_START=54 /DNA_END=2117 /DNA_ORIENTATION=-
MEPAFEEEPEYYLEWRRVVSRSMLIPSIKCSSAGATIENDLWIFGGKGANQFNDIWRFSASNVEWEAIEIEGSEIPPPRDGHSFTKVSPTKFIVFGGQGNLLDSGVCERGTENGKVKYLSMRQLYDDMYEFDCETRRWTFMPRRKVRPLARRGHCMKYVKYDVPLKGINNGNDSDNQSKLGYLILFGGSCLDIQTGFERASNDVWVYCLTTRTWKEMTCDGILPHPVYGHCAEVVENWLVVVGGNVVPNKNAGPVQSTRDRIKPSKRKGRSDDYSIASVSQESAQETLGQNSISILNLATMCWSHMKVDNTSEFPPGCGVAGINLIGHSITLSPLNSKELYIFGGRRTDEVGMYSYSKNEFVPATLLKLNLETMKLSEVEVANSYSDETDVPEARINQVCVLTIDNPIQLQAIEVEDKTTQQRKGIVSRRVPTFPPKRAQLYPHAVLRLYGGTKLYCPGFCSGTMYELMFVPVEKKENSRTEVFGTESESRAPSREGSRYKRNGPTTAPRGRKKSTLELELESKNDSSTGEIFHMLNLKEDSSTALLSPKRGLHGQYFQLKTCLSRSRSTFIRPDTARSPVLPDLNRSRSPRQRRPASAPSTSVLMSDDSIMGSTLTGGEADATESVSSAAESLMSAKQLVEKQRREKIKQMSNVLSPITKGMPVHDARCVFNELFPPPFSPRRFVP